MASYGTVNGITALSPAISDINSTSTPNTSQATDWLEEGYTKINLALSGAGYVVPVLESALIFPALRSLNVLYATAYALRARGLDVVEGKEESRSEIYLKDFNSQLKALVAQDLTNMGVLLRPVGQTTRRGIRTLQLRRIDGYSAQYGSEESLYEGASE